MNKEFIGILVIKLLVAILLITTYLYIDKLEKTGCYCGEHYNKDFIKKFSLFAFCYYIITLLINPSSIKMNINIIKIYTIIEIIFLFMIAYYFYATIQYIRFLVNEKCKCSEDMRREFIMWGSIIELFLILIVFLNAMLIPVFTNSISTIIDNIPNTQKEIKNVLNDPLSSLKKSPNIIKKSLKNIINSSKSSINKINNNLSKR
jgi:predicted PurR-regulated permease PerM